MSVVLSNIANNKSINWQGANINILNQSKSGGGSVSGGVLTLPAHSSCEFSLTGPVTSKDIQYMKLKCNIIRSDSDEQFTDYNYNNIIQVIGSGKYNDDNIYINESLMFKFDDEQNFSNETIFEVNRCIINTLSVKVRNNSDESISIDKFVLDYNYNQVDEGNVNDYINEWADSNFDNKVNDYMTSPNNTLVIPLVQVLPDINSVPDGYICRLASSNNIVQGV